MSAPSRKDDPYQTLLEANREWVEETRQRDPELFDRLARGQSPPFLLVACCDSREALELATKAGPGQLFIHRNVANQVRADDPSMEATLEFGLGVLPVRHLVVSGHTRCGGVEAALGDGDGAVHRWVRPVRELAERHRDDLDRLPDLARRVDRLAELNVVQQIRNLVGYRVVRRRLEHGDLELHGWIFEVESGVLREIELPFDPGRGEEIPHG